jgi:hypothetical protein
MTKRLDKFAASPVGDKAEFKAAFVAAKAKYPGIVLGYIGTDGKNHFFQESGSPQEYKVPVSEGWKIEA